MKHNVGSYDAAVRFVLGCLILLWGVRSGSWYGLVGVVPLLTSIFGFCPLYVPLSLDTSGVDHRKAP
jgi:hypothetical protein